MIKLGHNKLFLILIVLLFTSGCVEVNIQDPNLSRISNKSWPKADFMTLSPSGRYLAVSEIGDKDFGSIYHIDLEDGVIRLLYETSPFEGALYVGDYSRNEDRLLFEASGNQPGIWQYYLDGTSDQQLLSPHGRPQWLSDNEIVTVDIYRGEVSFFIYDIDSGIESLIYMTDAVTIKGYSISENGRQIIYSEKKNSNNATDIETYEINTGIVTPIITTGYNLFPDWSPDDKYFAYSKWDNQMDRLHIYDIENGCDYKIDSINISVWNPLWNQDGTSIYFIHDGDIFNYDLVSHFGSSNNNEWGICQ